MAVGLFERGTKRGTICLKAVYLFGMSPLGAIASNYQVNNC